jgi:hypothetical protein
VAPSAALADAWAAITVQRSDRNAANASSAANGCDIDRVARQTVSSSIQIGMSWVRTMGSTARLQRASVPVVVSMIWWTCTACPTHGCHE